MDIKAWPFEIKATVAVWIVASLGALSLGWFETTKQAWQISFGIWWVFNFYAAIQLNFYRRLHRGFFAACWKITIDPDYRREVKKNKFWTPLAARRPSD